MPSIREHIVWCVCCLAIVGIYSVYIRPLIPDFYEGKPVPFGEWIEYVYPRFVIEKQRFPLDFFISKADQLIFRLIVVSYAGLCLFNILRTPKFRKWLFIKTSRKQVRLLQFVFYVLVAFFTYDWLSTLNDYQKLKVFYSPVSWIAWLGLPYFSPFWLLVTWLSYMISLILASFNLKGIWSASIAGILFVILQGYLQSFGKINHEYAPLTYLMLLMPFLIYETQKAKDTFESWSLQLMRIAAISGYVLSGIEKLLISNGMVWKDEPFCGLVHDKLPKFTSLFPIDGHVWAAIVVIFQISFVLVPFSSKSQKILLPLGVLFHISIWNFFGIGAIFHPWLVGYIFYSIQDRS
ncbi:MAG: hypothetical protein NZM38_02665 [Cytophagales bacterium]|nr:hypothetical protein [Cytophagales bacterium]MDW8383656.1 hypothetical protein [Flammeovirgaceae bacterium]